MRIEFASVTLGSDLSLNFYASDTVLAEFEAPYVVFSKAIYAADGSVTGTEEITVRDHPLTGRSGDTACQGFPFDGVAARELSSAVTATLYGTKNGLLCQGPTVSYSVRDYALQQLAATEDAKLRTLLVDMLIYGAKAQQYWNYNTANPATDGLTETQYGYATASAPTMNNHAQILSTDGASIRFSGFSLSLRERVAINFYLNLAAYDGDPNDLEARLTFTGADGVAHSVVIDSEDLCLETSAHARLCFSGLSAGQMRTPVSCALYSKSTGVLLSDTAVYSIESYAAAQSVSPDAILVSLIQAMLNYGDAAAAYFQ